LRFSRDKRGYEHTFVIHSDRRRGRARTRILYWFRTPPGVKVGRAALDEDAIRSIEAGNPDIDFDWPTILKEQPPAESAPRLPNAERRGPRRQQDGRPGRGGTDASSRPPQERRTAPRAEAPSPAPPDPAAQLDAPEREAVPDAPPTARAAQPPNEESAAPEQVADDGPITPAHVRLGSDGVHRLRARYTELLARIPERVPDHTRQDELKAQAERLNPDTWVSEEEVRLGLEQYESVLDALRTVVGQGRRRRRRSAGPRASGAEPPAAAPSESGIPDPGPALGVGEGHEDNEEPV